MKILVTGAKGQVGMALLRCARESALQVIGLDSRECNIADVQQLNRVLQIHRPDFIINAAAYTAVDKAESESVLAEQVNGVAVGELGRIAAELKIPLVHLSTDYVFDGHKPTAYMETDPVAPLGAYGRSKLLGEQLLQKQKGAWIILRTSWVFGIEGKNFPRTMLRLARERPEIGVVADQFGCPTFADDIARACLALAISVKNGGALPTGIYHYAGAEPCSWYEFAKYIFATALAERVLASQPILKPLKTSEYPTPARRPANSVLDTGLFRATFPDIPLSDWKKGVIQLLQTESQFKQ